MTLTENDEAVASPFSAWTGQGKVHGAGALKMTAEGAWELVTGSETDLAIFLEYYPIHARRIR